MKKIILAAAAALLLPFMAQAGDITAGSTPRTINYQGRLERDNAPITGTIHLYFRVYNHLTNSGAGVCGGVNQPCLWLSPEITVEATQGVFSATLEFSEADLLYIYSRPQTLYLEVQVESDVLAPREPMSSVAYAMVAKKLEDGSSVNFSTLTATYGVMLSTAPGAYMTVGTNSPYPTSKLTVSGDITLSNGGRIRFPDGSLLIDGFTGTNSGAVISASNATIEAGTSILFGIPTVAAGEKARITASGNFGINTQAPIGKLDVNGSLYVGDEGIYDRSDSTVNVRVNLGVDTGVIYGRGDESLRIGATNNVIALVSGGAERMRVHSNGNVGVGLTAPSEPLHSAGNMMADTGVRGGSVSIGAYSNTWTGAANEVRAADTTHLLLQQTNPYYVGIGTDTPREKLHVRGSILSDYGVRAGTGVFTNDVTMSGNLNANGNNKQVFLTSTTIYGTLSVTGGIGSAAGFPAYIASTQTFTGLNIFENQVEVSSDIFTVNRIGVGVTDFDFAGAKYLQVGDDKAEYSNHDALVYLVGGDNADAVLNFYRGGVESARIESQMGRNLALVVEGQTKTLTDKTYHRIQNSVVWISTGYASTPAIYVSSYMGNVGMGTPVLDPNWRLTVEGNLRISTMSSPGQSYGIIFADGSSMNTAANIGSATGLSNNSDAVIQSDADQSGSGSVLLRAGSLDGLILNSGGNVGIGTVNPVSKLNVRGGDLVLGSPVNPYAYNSQEDLIVGGHIVFDGALIQRSASAVELSNLIVANSVFLSTAAAVNDARTGIGTIVPLQRLHVASGDINVDSGYGFRVGNTAPLGWYLRGTGGVTPHYAPSLIQAPDLPITIVRTTTTISTTLPLAGGNDLSANRTFSIGGLSTLGTGNYVVGANNGATGWEYKQLTGSASEIDITHTAGGIEIGIIDPLIVGKGGTGVATFITNGVLYGNGTGVVQDTVAGTQYQVLRANATGVPVFGSINLDQAAAVTGILPVGNGGTGVGATLDGVLRGNLAGVVTAMTGTANNLVKWGAGGNNITNSIITDDGTNAGVGVAPTVGIKLDVNGKLRATTFQVTNNPTSGHVLTSDAAGNASWQDVNTFSADSAVGNEVTDTADATLTRSGAGWSGNPWKLALNLGNPNTWTGAQTFNGGFTCTDCVALGGETSGTLPVSEGGTGTGTTLSGVLLGGSPITAIAGLASQYLRRNAGNTAYEFGGIDTGHITSGTLGFGRGGTGTTAIAAGVVRSDGTSLAAGAVALGGAEVTGILPVARGGTGLGTFTAGVLYANGALDFTTVAGAAGVQTFTVARTTTTTGSPCNVWSFNNGVLTGVGANIACP